MEEMSCKITVHMSLSQPEPTLKPLDDTNLQAPSKDQQNPKKRKRGLPEWMTTKETDEDTKRKLFDRNQSKHTIKEKFLAEESAYLATEEGAALLKELPHYCVFSDMTELNRGRVICFDVETTGFSKTDQIIEIGGVEIIDGIRTGAIFQSYICPTVQVSSFASEVHGLTNLKLTSALPAKVIIPSFLSWVGTSQLVAHNASFDMRM